MPSKHIIEFGSYSFAVDSITTATNAVAILSKLKPCDHVTSGEYDDWHFAPDTRNPPRIQLLMNQPWREPKKPKPTKALGLPAPRKGSITCICEKSNVAPGQTCPHCGRDFTESHNRTHA